MPQSLNIFVLHEVPPSKDSNAIRSISLKSIYPYIPYFYIIQHIESQKFYAGCRVSQKPTKISCNGCHPIELLTIAGYKTSSTIIKKIIKEFGIKSFKIVLLLEESECMMSVHDYETIFLQTWDIANNDNWFNKHNNDVYYDKFNNRSGTKVYNDGFKNIDVGETDYISPSWKLGMLKNSQLKSATTRKNSFWVNNGIEEKLLMSTDTKPDGWEFGKLKMVEWLGKTTENYKWYNDGINKFLLSPEEIQDTKLIPGLKGMVGPNKGFKTYNNGVREFSISSSTIPDPSWLRGRLVSPGKNKIWINDGLVNKRILPNHQIPDGFILGFISPNRKSQSILKTDSITPESVMANSLCSS